MPSLRFTVTGSIACGKSYTCRRLKAALEQAGLSCTIIDADQVRAEILSCRSNPDFTRIQKQLLSIFGSEAGNPDGSINRARLSDLVFARREAALIQAEALNPVLIKELRSRLNHAKGVVLLEWALAAEHNLIALTDYNVLLVRCSRKTQLRRLSGGDLPPHIARRRIAWQLSNDDKQAAVQRMQRSAGRGRLLVLHTDGPAREDGFAEIAAKMQRFGHRLSENS